MIHAGPQLSLDSLNRRRLRTESDKRDISIRESVKPNEPMLAATTGDIELGLRLVGVASRQGLQWKLPTAASIK